MNSIVKKQWMFVLVFALLLVMALVLMAIASLHILHLPPAYILASAVHPDTISHSH